MNPLIADFLVDDSTNIYKAHWMLYRNGRILCVCKDDIFVGVITFADIRKTYKHTDYSILQVCNRDCFYIVGENYDAAKLIFADNPKVRDIPILNESHKVEGLLSREQVFWKQYYRNDKLPRMHYAYCIYNAAFEAKMLGYKAISVLEFGVAGGNGLVCCEFHAKEIEKLFDLKIEIYGFDTGCGMPSDNPDYRNMVHVWPDLSFNMDVDKLEKRLSKSKLVIGKIEETTKNFIGECNPAPIGCMFVDVDRYSSTVPIMEMLEMDDKYFMPRVHMYYDDLTPEYLFQGENLAIMEFNSRNSRYKISPEGLAEPGYKLKVKTCHRFYHPKYNDTIMLQDGLEISNEMLEAPLSAGLERYEDMIL